MALGALTAAAGFTVTTTASAGAQNGATDANDVTAEDSAALGDPWCIAYPPSGQPQGADLLLSGESLAGLPRRLIAAPASPSLKSAYRYGHGAVG
jgi:hypothetical protein